MELGEQREVEGQTKGSATAGGRGGVGSGGEGWGGEEAHMHAYKPILLTALECFESLDGVSE